MRRFFLVSLSLFALIHCRREASPENETLPQPPVVAPPAPEIPPAGTSPPDRDLSPVPDLGIPYTHEEMEHYRQLKRKIWASQLGNLFSQFIDEHQSPENVLMLSSRVTERIFLTPEEELIRVAALQVLVEDLYERGLFTPEISYRLTVLEGNVRQRQAIVSSVPIEKLVAQVPLFLVIAFLHGSPEIASQTQGALNALKSSTARAWQSRSAREFLPLEDEDLNLRRLASPQFFAGYRPIRALHGFINTFAPYSFIYMYLYRQYRPYGHEFGPTRILLSGLEQLLEFGEL